MWVSSLLGSRSLQEVCASCLRHCETRSPSRHPEGRSDVRISSACPGFLPSSTDETRKCSLLSILSLQKRGGVAQSNAGEPLGLARDDVLVIYWTDDEAELLFAFDSMLRTWESSPRVDCCDSGLHKVKVDICLSVRSHILASKFLKLERVTLISML